MSEEVSNLKVLWLRYGKNRPAVVSLVVLAFLVFVAIMGPLLSPFDPFLITPNAFVSPNHEHFMGTDDLGRDVYSRVLLGSRTSLFVGSVAAFTSLIIGLIAGALSGYFGGAVDRVIMALTDFFLTIPLVVFGLVLVTIFGSSIQNVILVIGVLTWPGTARIVRSQFLSLKERTFVEAARAVGAADVYIIFREIMPNALSPVVINASYQIARAILLEAGLSFLGLGDPNMVSWGAMLNEAQRFFSFSWWTAVFPGVAILLTTVALNLIGDGFNDAMNPRLKGRRV